MCRLCPAFHECRKILGRKEGERNLQDSQSRAYFPNMSNFQKLKCASLVLDTRGREKTLGSTCILLSSLSFREVQARGRLLRASSVGQQYRQSRSEMRGYWCHPSPTQSESLRAGSGPRSSGICILTRDPEQVLLIEWSSGGENQLHLELGRNADIHQTWETPRVRPSRRL